MSQNSHKAQGLLIAKKMHSCLVHEAKKHRGYSCIAKETHLGLLHKAKAQAKSERGYASITKGSAWALFGRSNVTEHTLGVLQAVHLGLFERSHVTEHTVGLLKRQRTWACSGRAAGRPCRAR